MAFANREELEKRGMGMWDNYRIGIKLTSE
jgi:hypothetical protein